MDIGCDDMVRDNMLQSVEPEERELGQDLSLVWDTLRTTVMRLQRKRKLFRTFRRITS